MEMKKSKVNECFYLLARTIDFEHSVTNNILCIFLLIILIKIFTVVNYIKTLLDSEKTLSLKIINKCEEALRNILEGLCHNQSLKPDHLLLFCYSLIKESLNNMQKAEDKDLMVDNLALGLNKLLDILLIIICLRL